jgi:hypothetical protein
MSSPTDDQPTRCVAVSDGRGGTSEACLWVDADDGFSCTAAAWNEEACTGCEYVAEGLCETTRSGYTLDCTNVNPGFADLRICGDQILFVPLEEPADSGDDFQVTVWPLVLFSLIFCFALCTRCYVEVRRKREGLEEDPASEEASLKESAPYVRNAKEGGPPPVESDSDEDSSSGEKKTFFSTKKAPSPLGVKKSPVNKSISPVGDKSPFVKNVVKKMNGPVVNKKAGNSGGSKKAGKSGGNKKASNRGDDKKDLLGVFKTVPLATDDRESDAVSAASATVPYEETENDPLAHALRMMHDNQDWKAIAAFFAKIRRRIIERQHYMALLVQIISEDWPTSVRHDRIYCGYLDNWYQADPDNLQCRVIRLEVWIAWAWHGRGPSFAQTVTADRVELFYGRLDQAATELVETLQVVKKRDALVYAAAISLGTGRNDDQTTVHTYLQAVQTSNDPASFKFHTRALQYFCEKWHGSNQEALDYARFITQQLPVGHPLACLIVQAHYEVALLLKPEERNSYWLAQRDEILAAYEKGLGGQWEMKINVLVSPACLKLDAVVRNWFFYAAALCQATDLAHRQAKVIGNRPVAELPWGEKVTYASFVESLGITCDVYGFDTIPNTSTVGTESALHTIKQPEHTIVFY